MKAFKRLIRGTALDPVARKAWNSESMKSLRRLTGNLEWQDERHALYDQWTKEVIRRVARVDSNCVDVGAHAGAILRHIVAHAPRGIHYAFEPLPSFAMCLRADFPNVRVLEVALSDTSGTASFRRVKGDAAGYSGFERRPWDTYDEGDVEVIQVQMDRLDDVLPSKLPIRFSKVDVEGAELRVLTGAMRTLKTHRPYVAFELTDSPALAYELLAEEVGLSISLLGSWLKGKKPLSRNRFVDEWQSGRHYFFLAHPS